MQKIQSGRKEDAGASSKKEKHEKNARVVGHRTYWALNGSYWWERGNCVMESEEKISE